MPEEPKPYYFGTDELKHLRLIMRAGLEADRILDVLDKSGVEVTYFRDKVKAVYPTIEDILWEYIPKGERRAFFEAIKPPEPPKPVELIEPEIEPSPF